MKIIKKVIVLGVALMVTLLPMNRVLAAEVNTTVDYNISMENIYDEIPSLEIIENVEDGTYSICAVDSKNNVIYEKNGLTGSIDDVIYQVYSEIYSFTACSRACSHVPYSHNVVQGGVNHIINSSTGFCTMVTSKFYQCAGCGEILGMVSGSTTVVGTHYH